MNDLSSGGQRMMCREVIELLADYLEATLTADVIERLEAHLRDCAPCVAYLNTYRRTRDMATQVNRVEMPDEMKARLRTFLLGRLREIRRPCDNPAGLGD